MFPDRPRTKSGRLSSIWTPSKKALARKLYINEEQSLRAVADVLKCAHATVQKLAEAEGWIRKRYVELPEKKIVLSYRKGATCAELADQYGVSHSKIERMLKEHEALRSKVEQRKLMVEQGKHRSRQQIRVSIREKIRLDLSKLSYDEYKRTVYKLTRSVMGLYAEFIPNAEKWSRQYHVDHMLSVFSGYFKWSDIQQTLIRRKKPVPLEELCHPANLNVVYYKANIKKGSGSTFSRRSLQHRIKLINSRIGHDPFSV